MNNEELKEVLEDLNYKNYKEIFNDYAKQKITIGLSNIACRQITKIEKPIFANFGVFIGLLPSIAITIFFSVHYSNYLYLLLILLELLLPYICYLLDGFNSKWIYIAYILLIVDFLIVRLPSEVTIIYLSVICCSLGVKIWRNSLFKSTISIMQKRSDTFVWAYNSYNLFIKDNKGNFYRKKLDIEKENNINKVAESMFDNEYGEEFICNNCGAEVAEGATECPNCGYTFIDENENNEEQFVCDNCGNLVNASATKCPNCGELFEDISETKNKDDTNNKENRKKKNDKESKSDIDQKYSDLNKLKKLLDKKIITKEEFEKEKKKILNK